MEKIGFIGMGNMGYAMLCGALKFFQPSDIVITDVNKQRVFEVNKEKGVLYADNNAECANRTKYLVLAVKPQYYDAVLKNIKHMVTKDHVVISIAPGISISDLQDRLGTDKRIVRAMPNTPALLGEGMTGICYDEKVFTEEEKKIIDAFFSSFGKYEIVEERLIDAVVCASGSSPAYVYLFIEALADSAVKYGLSREKAYQFAAGAVAGAARMVLETKEHPAVLKDKVCSPGGTTIAAVEALEEYGFRNAVMKASDACYEKCISMKK